MASVCLLDEKGIEELNPSNILPQTSFWARVKDHHGFAPKAFSLQVSNALLSTDSSASAHTEDDLLVLLKSINSEYCYAYIPYGPKLEPAFENQGRFLEELSESLKSYLPSNCAFIRYDLMWKNQWANDEAYFDEHNNWLGPPNTQAQELRVNFSTQLWNLKKSSQDILPKNTFFIDLNKSEQDLLKDMRPNTRYKIRQSQNQGIVIRTALQASVQDWYKVYAETCQRHGMSQQEQSYFEALIAQHQHGKDEVQVHLLTAEYQDKVIASMFQVICNTRAVYLYGASLSMQGNIRASYALQWASIQFAKSKGCTEYDMFGAAPNMLNPSHPLHGVHKYKKGFGGYLYHRMGCWDYPIHSKIYHAFSMQERQN